MENKLANQQAKGLILQRAVNEIIEKSSNLNKYAFDIARKLEMIKEKGLWKYDDCTQPYNGFEQWYEYSGIPVKWDTARQWIRVYKELVVKLGYTPEQLADIDFYKLRLVCQVALQDPTKVPTTLEQAKRLSYRDLFLAIKQDGMDIGVCTHPELEQIMVYKCRLCKQSFKKRPEEEISVEEHSGMVDGVIMEFMKKTELKELAESTKLSRQYASLLLKKYPRQLISDCLDDMLADDFWKDKLTKVSHLYRQMPAFERDSEPIKGDETNLPTQ